MSDAAELATVQDAATRYGCSVRTIRRLIEKGTLQAYRLGPRTTRIDLTHADKQLLRAGVKTAGESQ